MRPCPACGRKVQDAAPKCHYCGAAVPRVSRVERAGNPPAPPREQPARSGGSLTLWIIAAVVLIVLIVGLLVAVWR